MKLVYELSNLLDERYEGEYALEISDEEFIDEVYAYFEKHNTEFNEGADSVLDYLRENGLFDVLAEVLEEDEAFVDCAKEDFKSKAIDAWYEEHGDEEGY